MTRPQTLEDRRRYLEGWLADLACDHCGVVVRVKKNSGEHTSVQWTVAAAARCDEFAMHRGTGLTSALVPACGRLRASIDRAVAVGRLCVAPSEAPP
ncbi:MAG TPA: hypothetical protein VH561_18785 [Micromonosporaceae bacterium]|jgi:hypothetical protein